MAKRVRRIMKQFTLLEISAVDKPAQEHALATLMKRDTQPVDPSRSS